MIKKVMAIIIPLILVMVYVLCVNPALCAVLEEQYIMQLQAADYELPEQDTVYCAIDSMNVNSGILEYVDLIGWAFAKTDDDNANRSCHVVLYSPQKVYILPCELYGRADVAAAFSGTPSVQRNHTVGIRAKFYTFSIAPGEYDMYLYDHENTLNFGVVYTGITLRKQGTTTDIIR